MHLNEYIDTQTAISILHMYTVYNSVFGVYVSTCVKVSTCLHVFVPKCKETNARVTVASTSQKLCLKVSTQKCACQVHKK